MESTVTANIDQAIEDYKAMHRGENPLYCIMSMEEADQLAEALKRRDGATDLIITSYQDIKLIRNEFMDRGEYFLSNELPETGS